MFGSLFVFRGRASPATEFAVSFAAAALVVAIWELVARAGVIAPQFLPSPSRVVTALWTMLVDQNLLWHVAVSTARVWIAFLLAAAMAIPIGIMMSSYRIVGAALEPMIDFIRYLPVPALVPLSIIWFGVGEETKIFLLWLGTFFQLVLLVADDMRRVPQEFVEVACTVGANSAAGDDRRRAALDGTDADRQSQDHARLVLDLSHHRRDRRRGFRHRLCHLDGAPLRQDARGDGRASSSSA